MNTQVDVIVVIETWHLKPEFQHDALRVMQQMDEMLGPGAHSHPGWCGHARFLQRAEHPGEILMIYPWKSRALHEDLVAREELKLGAFVREYCSKPRLIEYHRELPVDVELS